MTLKAYIGKTPVEKIFLGTSQIPKVLLGSHELTVGSNPATLFAGGKQGVWYDPSDKSTLFQDVAGTVPVTKDGDPVALMRDKSGNGNHAVQTVSTARPIYKTDGILHWLQLDGVDDHFPIPLAAMGLPSESITISAAAANTGSGFYLVGSTSDSDLQLLLHDTGARSSLKATNGIITIGIATGLFAVNTNTVTSAAYNRLTGKHDLLINGVQRYTNTRAAADRLQTQAAIGQMGISNVSLFKGRIYSMIIINEVLSGDRKTNVDKYLATKSGVTL